MFEVKALEYIPGLVGIRIESDFSDETEERDVRTEQAGI